MSHERKGVTIIYPKGFERKNEDLSEIQTSTETLNIDKSDEFIVKEESNFEEASNESEMSNVTDTGMSKPKMSYAKLISEALLNSPSGMLILSDIYQSISARHPYYQMNVTGWQNSIRHNLSLNQSFVKCTDGLKKAKDGKYSNYWKLSENLSKSDMSKSSKEDFSEIQKSTETLNIDKTVILPDMTEVCYFSERKIEDLSEIQASTETLNINKSDALIVKEESNFEEASNESEISNSPSFINHMESVHSVKEQYQCPVCDKMFNHKQSIPKHVASVHEGQKPYKCSICNKVLLKIQI